jgi:hypothetical protein
VPGSAGPQLEPDHRPPAAPPHREANPATSPEPPAIFRVIPGSAKFRYSGAAAVSDLDPDPPGPGPDRDHDDGSGEEAQVQGL